MESRRDQLKLGFFNKLRANSNFIGKIWDYRRIKTQVASLNGHNTEGMASECLQLLEKYNLGEEWHIQAAENHSHWKNKIRRVTALKSWKTDMETLNKTNHPLAAFFENLGAYSQSATSRGERKY